MSDGERSRARVESAAGPGLEPGPPISETGDTTINLSRKHYHFTKFNPNLLSGNRESFVLSLA